MHEYLWFSPRSLHSSRNYWCVFRCVRNCFYAVLSKRAILTSRPITAIYSAHRATHIAHKPGTPICYHRHHHHHHHHHPHQKQLVVRGLQYSDTRNTLDCEICDQSNYSSRIFSPTYLLYFVNPEMAPFDPPKPKTPLRQQERWQTARQTEAGDFIICPTLCYSNGSKKCQPVLNDKIIISAHTLRWVHADEVRFRSEHDLLQKDSEAVGVSFLSSVDGSSCHTQQLRCCPQLISVKSKLIHLRRYTCIHCAS